MKTKPKKKLTERQKFEKWINKTFRGGLLETDHWQMEKCWLASARVRRGSEIAEYDFS